jgi:uncharacterized delta-60 repeat protein
MMKTRFRPQAETLEGRALLSTGALDTSFGGTGMVTSTIGTRSQSNAVAVQADSKVVVVGFSSGKSAGPFTVARYNTNGSLDSTFGSGGIAVVPISNLGSPSQATAVTIQPSDGKILVAGTGAISVMKNGGYDSEFVLARLNPNGTLDKTFGGGKGYVMTNVAPEVWMGESYPSSIFIQPGGQIVVGGALNEVELNNNPIDALALVRYNANGSLDTTFGAGGEVIDNNILPSYVSSGTIAMDSFGRIEAVGQSTAGTNPFVAVRYLANGALDPAFGTRGYSGALPLTWASAVALQSTGKLVVGGISGSQDELIRLNTDGSLDLTFGTNGVYSESRLSGIGSIVIQPADDKIVVVADGLINGKVDSNFWVTRVLADGSAYDPTFGTNGLSEANSNSGPSSVALDPSGRILVTGAANFATARFLG